MIEFSDGIGNVCGISILFLRLPPPLDEKSVFLHCPFNRQRDSLSFHEMAPTGMGELITRGVIGERIV